MTRRRKFMLLVAALLPLILIGGALLYLRFADLSGWKDTVARFASDAIGREIQIIGEFQPEIGFTTRLTAGNITLANPDWSSDPTMASVQRLTVELDLLSLVSGPLTIHDIEIEGVRVLLEKNADGRANWVFNTGSDSTPSNKPLELVVQRVLVDDLQLTLNDPSRSKPLNAEVTKFESTGDGAGMLDLELDGAIDGRNIKLSGRLGTLTGLLRAAAGEFDLAGELAGVHFASRGNVAELKNLRGADITVDVHGDDLSDLHGLVELPPEFTGPFSLSVAVSPSGGGSDLELDAAAGGITAQVVGNVDSLVAPKVLDATVTATGPSIRTVGALTGVADLPDDAFSISGGVHWEGFPVTFRQVEITVGENSLTADGVLGAPPTMMGTDFSVHGEGPNIGSIGALTGIKLPRDRYSVKGRVVRIDRGLEIEDVEARIGPTVVTVDGRVGDPPDYADTTLEVHAEGPNIARFNRLIGINLPAVEFAIDGRLSEGLQAINLDGVTIRIGTSRVHGDGALHTGPGLTGSAFRIEAQGSDATQIVLLAGFTNFPAEPWKAAGGLTFVDEGYRLDRVSANFGQLKVSADGLIAAAHRSVGTNLRLRIEDPDLADVMSVFGVDDFPHQPVLATGGLKIEDSGYRLDGVAVTAGDIEIAVDGLIGGGSDLEGTRAHLKVHGPRLDSIGPYFNLQGLPNAPFSVSGEVQVVGGRVKLDNVASTVDSNRLEVHGTVVPVPGLVGTDVHIDLSAPDLGRAGKLAAGLFDLPDLPPEAFTMATHLRIDEAGYEIDGMRITLDRAEAIVDGRVGAALGFVGTNLTVTADGPKASLFSALTGVKVPVAPFKVSGRVERTEDFFIFDRVAIRLGGHAVDVHGSLGEKPHLIGTDLDLHVSGPGTGLIADLTGFNKLPDKPFEVAGVFHGTHEKFTAKKLEITLGESDLKGSLEVDIQDKPELTADISSNYFDLAWLVPHRVADAGSTTDTQPTTNTPKGGLVFSEKPIDFGWLQRADAIVDLAVSKLQAPVERFHDVSVKARLEDGRLEVHRLAMAGSRGGSGSGSLVFEPVGDSYRVEMDLDLNAIRFALPGEDAPDSAAEPPLDFDVRLTAHGASPHDFAGSSDGRVQVVVGKGVMDNRVLDLISTDILLTLLNAFNPFAKEDVATELQCAVVLLTFDQGIATLKPMALQSDKMTMLGKGKIDLGTEKLDLEWVTKPRKGIGISASVITNPYIKLGGTLSKPAIELKPMEAIASTGVAVATLGISVVAKGMLDRVTAEKKVCKTALEEIDQIATGSATKSARKK